MVPMTEPHASEFARLIRAGAGARDIHGVASDVGFAERTRASDAFLAREFARVEAHARGACSLLEAFTGRAPSILDVGCSTGGSAVAMALSPVLSPDVVVGVDPEALSLQAAEARARAYGLEWPRVAFRRCRPSRPLPFPSDSFDLVACVSVLEFVPTPIERQRLVDEMKRVVRPGGHLFIATPNPFRLRDMHAKRWLGDFRRRDGYPWASPPWAVRAMFHDCERVPIQSWIGGRALERATGLPFRRAPSPIAEAFASVSAWQKLLVRKPPRHAFLS
jgi:SAM-dependent methyltransferase